MSKLEEAQNHLAALLKIQAGADALIDMQVSDGTRSQTQGDFLKAKWQETVEQAEAELVEVERQALRDKVRQQQQEES